MGSTPTRSRYVRQGSCANSHHSRERKSCRNRSSRTALSGRRAPTSVHRSAKKSNPTETSSFSGARMSDLATSGADEHPRSRGARECLELGRGRGPGGRIAVGSRISAEVCGAISEHQAAVEIVHLNTRDVYATDVEKSRFRRVGAARRATEAGFGSRVVAAHGRNSVSRSWLRVSAWTPADRLEPARVLPLDAASYRPCSHRTARRKASMAAGRCTPVSAAAGSVLASRPCGRSASSRAPRPAVRGGSAHRPARRRLVAPAATSLRTRWQARSRFD